MQHLYIRSLSQYSSCFSYRSVESFYISGLLGVLSHLCIFLSNVVFYVNRVDNKPKVFVDHVRRSSSSVDCPCRTEGFKRSELKVARRFPARSDDDLLFQVTFAIQAVLKLLSQRIEDNEDQRQLLFNCESICYHMILDPLLFFHQVSNCVI